MNPSDLEHTLRARLAELESGSLLRKLRVLESPQGRRATLEGREVLNFSSNDYLGFAAHPALKEAAVAEMERSGAGAGASRLISGSAQAHHGLEQEIARFKGTESALFFSSGYAAALGTIPALAGAGDFIVLDKLVHASIVDAARLSGAKLRVFNHNDLRSLEDKLRWCSAQRSSTTGAILVITESLFSMDGDIAPLPQIVELKERYGAWLMVDEAHATGLFGARRTGLAEEQGVSGRIEVQMGTLGKAAGAAGGYIAGKQALIEWLVNKARSLVFSTSPPPMISAAAMAGLKLIQSAEGAKALRQLRSNIGLFAELTGRKPPAPHSPIFPWHVGVEQAALELSARLLKTGIFAPAIRYPTVARKQARLRISFSAAHTHDDVQQLAAALLG